MAEDFTSEKPEKVIDLKPENEKRKTKHPIFSTFKWGILFLILMVLFAYAINHYFLKELGVPAAMRHEVKIPNDAANVPNFSVEENIPQTGSDKINPLTNPSEAVPENNTSDLKAQLSTLSEKVDHLSTANKNLYVYFAVRDLADSLNDAARFKTSLDYLRSASGDNPDITGKLDLLTDASSNGLVTKEKLLADLKTVQKNLHAGEQKTFSQNVQSAFGDLVKISKIEGAVDDSDSNSILKRAELRLSKDKISEADLDTSIDEVSKLGKPAEDWVKEANNLKRIIDVTNTLLDYAKSKLAQG